jgi:hypothetical protein
MFRSSRICRGLLLAALMGTPASPLWAQEPPYAEYVPGPPVINQHGAVESHLIVSEPVVIDDTGSPVPMDSAMGCSSDVPPKKSWHLFPQLAEKRPVKTAVHNEFHRYGLGCYATIDTVGCTSCGSEIQFIFGSCRAFFGEPCAMGGGTNHPYVPNYQGTVLNASLAPTYGTYPYARGAHWAALYPNALPPGAVGAHGGVGGNGAAGGNSAASSGADGGSYVAPYGAFSGCNCGANGRW